MTNPKTILLVDDDPDFTAVVEATLTAAGYRLLAAADEASGFELARAEGPDLALLDLMMEENDSGARLAHRLRRELPDWRAPIVILTAVRSATAFDFRPATADDFAWVGADAWVEKPITPQKLIALVSALLKEEDSLGGEPG